MNLVTGSMILLRRILLEDINKVEKSTPKEDMRALENRWIYRVNHESNSTSSRYKAILVVKGYSQRKGVDFFLKMRCFLLW